MLGDDDVEHYMFMLLNVREKVRLSLVNKTIKANVSEDTIKLFYKFKQWKLAIYKRQRVNSWSRKNYHPDERVIF